MPRSTITHRFPHSSGKRCETRCRLMSAPRGPIAMTDPAACRCGSRTFALYRGKGGHVTAVCLHCGGFALTADEWTAENETDVPEWDGLPDGGRSR